MTPAPLLVLPAEVLGCILHTALAADGSTMPSRCRLSLVTWHNSLRGAQPARAVGCARPLCC